MGKEYVNMIESINNTKDDISNDLSNIQTDTPLDDILTLPYDSVQVIPSEKVSKKKIVWASATLLLLVTVVVTCLLVIPKGFSGDENPYHLMKYRYFNHNFTPIHTVEMNDCSIALPADVKIIADLETVRTYISTESCTNLEFSIFKTSDLTLANMGDPSLVATPEEYDAFMKQYLTEDPNSLYAISYVTYAVDASKEITEYDGVSRLHRLFSSNQERICSNYQKIMSYETDTMIGFIIQQNVASDSSLVSYVVELYKKDDLYKCNKLILYSDNADIIFATINNINLK